MTPHTHLRIARPVSDLPRAVAMYAHGLDWQVLGEFADHAGFDGAMIGVPGERFHVELTWCRLHPVRPSPTPEDLLVFYVPEPTAWALRCDRLLAAGFAEVPAFNPYWSRLGRTFQDPDGYRIVIQQSAWS